MRIFYTAFDVVPAPKGASVHITHVLRALTDAGHEVDVMTPGDGVLPARDSYEGAQMLRVPPDGETHFLRRAMAFGQAVMAHVAAAPPYDVVQYRSIWSGLPLARAPHAYGYRTLFEVNGLPGIELKYHYPDVRDSDLLLKVREQELATLALSDALFCPSEVTRAYLVSLGVPRERITVIRNGFSPSSFAPTPLTPLSPEHRRPTILYIGTLADWQGIGTLVEAMPAVLEQQPAALLRVVGRGRSRQRKLLAKQVRKRGLEDAIRLEPSVPHHAVPALVAQADVCVAPLALNDRNLVQGCCPIKVIEYMAAGRPLVASNLPVVRELVREDVDGLLCTAGDAHDLARQVVRLLNNRALAERLARSAAERAHASLTWHEAGKRLLRLYDELSVSRR